IRLLPAGWFIGEQLTVTRYRRGMPVAGQVILCPPSTRNRPGRRRFPNMGTHLEVIDCRAITHTIVNALEEVIPPGEHQFVHWRIAHRSDLPEHRCRGAAGSAPAEVVPWADHDPLIVARES